MQQVLLPAQQQEQELGFSGLGVTRLFSGIQNRLQLFYARIEVFILLCDEIGNSTVFADLLLISGFFITIILYGTVIWPLEEIQINKIGGSNMEKDQNQQQEGVKKCP